MIGRIVVLPQDAYGRWLSAQPEGDDLAHEGARLFVARGCAGCHAPSSKVHAPNLAGLYGRTVQLADGRAAVADEAYIRDSILLPKRDVAAGYEPIMPSFSGALTEGEVQSLVAYIRSLASGPVAVDGAYPLTDGSLVPGTPPERSPAMTPGAAPSRPQASGSSQGTLP